MSVSKRIPYTATSTRTRELAGCTPSSVQCNATESSLRTFIDVGDLREPVRPRAATLAVAHNTACPDMRQVQNYPEDCMASV